MKDAPPHESNQANRQNEDHFRRIINVLPQFVAYVNPDLTYRYANPSSQAFFGLPPEQLVGRKTRDIIGARAHDAIQPYLEKVLAGETSHYQRDLVYPDDKVHTIDGWLIPDLSESGEVLGYYAILYDITHVKTAHEALREKDAKMRSIFRVAPIGIGITSNRTIVEVNDRLCRMLGYRQDELIGHNSRLLYGSDEEYDAAGAERRRQIWQHGSSSVETRMVRKDGAVITVLTNATPIDPGAPETAGIIFTVLDISNRKQAEQAVKTQSNTLDAIFNSTPSMLVLVDEEGRVEKINRRAVEFFGSDQEQVTNRLCGLLFRCINAVGPDACGAMAACPSCPIRSRFSETFRSGTPFREEEGEMTLRRGDHEVTYQLLISTAVITIEQIDKVLISITDISDIKRKEAELTRQRIAHEQLEQQYRQAQKMEPVGRLAGGIAHDLNNLLAPILGYSELLATDLTENDPRRAAVEQILYAGQRARDLIRQLLAFSRKQTLTFRSININELLSQFHRLLRRTIREDIQINLHLADPLPNIQGDTGQLEQVILNLAVNAQDAMVGSGELSFQTALAVPDDAERAEMDLGQAGPHVLLTITDTGIGMDGDTCAQVFEPFFTTKGQHSGTGLGLSTVYGIIKQHKGAIGVTSKPGRGTTFTIHLPATDRNLNQVEEEREASHPQVQGSETILLAEDDLNLRAMVETVLQKHGYTVLPAADGRQAAELAQSYPGRIDLLLTDVVMPEMNGRQLYERLAGQYPSIKALYMSGYTAEVLTDEGALDHRTELVQKPFSVMDLLARVRATLDRSVSSG
ncbi:PAS domain S-box protein [Desulfofustis glycolicus]|uniref:histidine kinase n=1 Tax=Desulfofustis glycolicus DSM 9705 TaxID=1121409 RepID=A0A1M5RX85_9BACT|nr:PAS domain S-box protein [Desulfofustis glycolicus]MCB2216334.1 PAS domain S-box protein [Desulfobulbaceae bacterium]SHH30962.1 PAS domain S-box-containing protein [Desulfofustis glycolicus DSM 9705]